MQINSQDRNGKVSTFMNGIRVVQSRSESLCIVLLLLACGALSAQNEEHRVRNIVLVHGAWADGSGWKGVYDILVKDGYHVSIVQEPETSFKDDVAATKRVLAQQDGPCILVAHSYGGACVEGTDMEVETKYPAGRLGRADRWLESPLGGCLGQKQAVLLRDGGAGEERLK